jgi:hypothetical protein
VTLLADRDRIRAGEHGDDGEHRADACPALPPASRHMTCSQENSDIRAGAIHTQHGIQETGASNSPKHAVTHRAATSCPPRWQRSPVSNRCGMKISGTSFTAAATPVSSPPYRDPRAVTASTSTATRLNRGPCCCVSVSEGLLSANGSAALRAEPESSVTGGNSICQL